MNERDVFSAFQFRGLSVEKKALGAVLEKVRSDGGGTRAGEKRELMSLVERIAANASGAAIITAQHVAAAIAALKPATAADVEAMRIAVVSAFDAPRLLYSTQRRSYSSEPRNGAPLHAAAETKVALFRDRYELVRQRVLRNPDFIVAPESSYHPPASSSSPVGSSSASAMMGSMLPAGAVGLTSVEALTGSTGYHCVLGIVSQTSEGWALEDLSSRIPVAFDNPAHSDGLFAENSVVLATGIIVEGVFRVSMVGLPPPELRELTAKAIGQSVDFFGSAPSAALVEQMERDPLGTAASALFFSDVWLDCPDVVERLRNVLAKLEEMNREPDLVVLMGNFTSRPFGGGMDQSALPPLFDSLGALIRSCPRTAKNTKFVVVPGPNDPCGTFGGPLPRMPMPRAIVAPLMQRVGESRVILATNPCRLRLCLEDIVLFREDIVSKVHRHCFLPSDATTLDKLSKDFAHTIVAEAHLCPLPLGVVPVYWNYDHSLVLHPLPHVAVVGDKAGTFLEKDTGCIVVNPGPFGRDGTFMSYTTATPDSPSRAERCKV